MRKLVLKIWQWLLGPISRYELARDVLVSLSIILLIGIAFSQQQNFGNGSGSTLTAPLNSIVASNNCAPSQARCFQLPTSGGILWDCVWGNVSSTITCPDAVFTSANTQGMIAFCANNPDLTGGGGEVTGTVIQCGASGSRATLTYISSTQVSISPNTTTGACTYSAPAQGCMLAWYNLADSQFTSAWAAAASSPDCLSLQTSAGVWGISTANFNTGTAACKLGVGIARTGPGFRGQGMGSTILVLDPAFNFASCTQGTSGAGCLFTSGGIQLQDFQVFGGCNPINSAHANNLIELDSGIANTTTLLDNVSFSCFGGNSSGLVGVSIYNNTPQPANGVWIQDFGTINLSETATSGGTGFSVSGLFIEDCALACFQLTSNTFLVNSNSVFGPCTGSNCNTANVGAGYWKDVGGVVNYAATGQSTTGNAIQIGASGLAVLSQTGIQQPTTNTANVVLFNSTNGTLYTDEAIMQNLGTSGAASAVLFNSTGNRIFTKGTKWANASSYLFNFNTQGATNQIYDIGGNTFSSTFPVGNASAGNIIGANSVTGTAVTSAKTVLSAGWGSTAAVTAMTGFTSPIQFTITNSGTGQATGATITYTFPSPYLQAPQYCSAVQVGGTQTALTYSVGTPTATSVVITETGAPTAAATEIMQVSCSVWQ